MDKPAWRARLLAGRAAVPLSVRVAEAAALASWVGVLSGTVCCYHPIGTEPGSSSMLDALLAAGCRVLLPVVAVRAAPLDWAEYSGPVAMHDASGGVGVSGGPGAAGGPGTAGGLGRGPYGLVEPTGPRLGPSAVAQAGTILVPALAVDRGGVRLGRGAGYYDRSLVLASPDAALVAVVRDPELVPRLPSEPHDVLMTAALTPSAGFTPLP